MKFEAEVDCGNANLFIRPLGRTLRGKFDPLRSPTMTELIQRFPTGIPGQRIRYDFQTGEGAILEPLQDSPLKEQLAKYGKLPPREQGFSLDAATAHYWLKPLVEVGKLKVTSGELPKRVEGTPRKRIFSEEKPSDMQLVMSALERLASSFEKLATALAKK